MGQYDNEIRIDNTHYLFKDFNGYTGRELLSFDVLEFKHTIKHSNDWLNGIWKCKGGEYVQWESEALKYLKN